ncbi:MAG: type I restriction endonuclease [Acidobacteriota bacterium]
MAFLDKIAALAQRVPSVLEHLQTEEATKNALVMPFLAALGYDVFNPHEVVPEFVADVGTKKGEKVDYAVKKDDVVILLVECKKASADLSKADVSQLYRYFSVTNARIAILTNGVEYRFFSDLEAPNKMDRLPFLELDLRSPRQGVLREVAKLGKENFDLDRMLSAANELKFLAEIQKIIARQIEDPEEEFVRFFFSRASPGSRFTSSARETFAPLVSRAFGQFVKEQVNSRLRSALESESPDAEPEAPTKEPELEAKDGIVTTEEELEAYRIVRAIACQAVPIERVIFRDTKSYMGVLLDDNNRKPVCRLHFNSRQRYIGVFDRDKKETRIPLDSLSDIYLVSDRLLSTIEAYVKDED